MPNSIPFRYRAHEVSRVEAFSDVIFGFAISLLVVSLEAPKSYAQMVEMLRGFLPFAICFFLLIDIWFEHHDFFKRYALQDRTTMVLNTLLLFVILFYVYPMKYMFTLFAQQLRGEHVELPPGGTQLLFVVYGVGVLAVFGLLGALYAHAYRRADDLGLNEVERIDTRESLYDNLCMASFGIFSMILAYVAPQFAGPVYFLIAVPKTLVPTIMGRKRRQLEARKLAATA